MHPLPPSLRPVCYFEHAACITVRPRLSEQPETPLSDTKLLETVSPIGFHFTPLIRKLRSPTPTRKFRYEYVTSIEKTLNRITQLSFSCLLNHNGSVDVNFLRTMNVTAAELASCNWGLFCSSFYAFKSHSECIVYVHRSDLLINKENYECFI